MKYLLAALALLILAGAGFKIMNIFTKNTAPEIVEVRDFRCEGMEGFTFKYPVFKGWEVKDTTNESWGCTISLKTQSNNFIDSEFPPMIRITKLTYSELPNVLDAKGTAKNKNNNGVIYDMVSRDAAVFYAEEYSIQVELRTSDAFPADLFWKQVIESFKIVEVSQAAKFAGSWMWSEEAWGQDVDKLQSFLASEQFSLDLEVTGNNISGFHCWSKSYSVGEKTETQKDCGDQEKIPSITGKINGSTADVSFSSYTDGTTYMVRLEYDSASDSLRWQIAGYPEKISQSGFPAEVSLGRKLGTPL